MEENKEQKVWVTISETIKTGDYQNVKIELGFSKVYDKQSPSELIEEGLNELEGIVKKKAKKIRRKAKWRGKS